MPEVGRHDMRFAIIPTNGHADPRRAIASARAFNHELKVINTDAHEGTLPDAGSFVSVSPGSVVLDAIKKAEDDDALVLRLYDPSGKTAQAKVTFDRLCGRVKSAVETDVLERPLKKGSAKVSGNAVTVRVPKRGIATVKVALGKG
jgi:alpha-mannosidase